MKTAIVPKNVMLLALLIGACAILAYLPALNLGFVNWDDDVYIYQNRNVLFPTYRFLPWAFTTFQVDNWHPLTWLSLGLDRLLWGTGPMGFHATNVVLHGLNTALATMLAAMLIAAARNAPDREGKGSGLTEGGGMLAAAATGILFGFHPIHVESVAWISERKDVLCALFYLTGALTYLNYAGDRAIRTEAGPWYRGRSARLYFLTLGLFVFALLSKPMAVTFPVVLLILDWYPLARFPRERYAALVMEKLPFFALSIASSVVTIIAQENAGSMKSLAALPLSHRLLNGAQALVLYLWKMLAPVNLVPFYPYPRDISLLSLKYLGAFLAVAALAASCVALLKLKKGRYWTAAWCYFLVTLLPVLGIIHVGLQSMADRYAYLPSLGPFLLVGLGLAVVFQVISGPAEGPSSKRYAVVALLGALTLVLSSLTVRQIGVWKDGLTLWNYVIKKDPVSAAGKAYNHRGLMYLELNRPEEALRDLNTAVMKSGPNDISGYLHRGNIFILMGRNDEAVADFSSALRIRPDAAFLYFNRGSAYRLLRQFDKAIADFSKAISFDPGFDAAYGRRGAVKFSAGRYDEAIEDCRTAIQLNPDSAGYYLTSGLAYAAKGMYRTAIEFYNRAAVLAPNAPEVAFYRGNAYRKSGSASKAALDFEAACASGHQESCGALKSQDRPEHEIPNSVKKGAL